MYSPGIGIKIVPRMSVTSVSVVTATVATGIGATSFTANWNPYSGAQYYLLDVSTSSSFSSFILQNQVVSTNSYLVTGLTANTTYYYRVRASTDPLPYLLDAYPSAAAAYSLRKLRAAYSGSAIRVRRTDLTEQNIGFDATGNLDTAALLSFVGTGATDNGFVTTWYDQSGNNRNATQSTAANQPQIVSSGNVLTLNSKPTIIASPTQNWSFSSGISITLYSLFMTYYKTATGNQAVLGSGAVDYMWLDYELTQIVANNGSITISNNLPINTQMLYSAIIDKLTTSEIFKNNISIGSRGSFGGGNYNLTEFPYSIARTANLDLQEIIIYSSNQGSNSSAINTNINSYYGIY